jgi:tetratricopeptide (TPR) repeat protein
MAQQRDRGRYLSNKGLKKLHKALDDTFLEEKWTSEKLSEWTDPANNEEAVRSVSKDTVRKIVNRRGKCDIPYIEALFQAFGVELEKDDLTIEPPITPTPDPPPIPKPEEDPNFIGRESAIADLDNLVKQGAKCILILSRGGEGKTVLAQKYLQQQFDTVVDFWIGKERQNITSVNSLIEYQLRQLGEEPGRELGISLVRLKQKLQSQQIGILIDNLEPVLDRSGRLIEPHRDYLELLRVLTDVTTQSITLITSREPLKEGLDVPPYYLPGLSQETWQKYFKYKGIATDIKTLQPIHTAYGGNALAMRTICGAIRYDPEYQGSVQKYWGECKTEEGLLVEDAIDNLIKEQFERLENIYLEAYNLLCRMGCYRYQDVPTVPKQGLYSLLWDIPQEKQKQKVVKALRERNLVDYSHGEYKLHPVVREEAISRLRNSEDWETANHKAAEFWTEDSVTVIETIEEAQKAFEAYYHYVAINALYKAGKIIIQKRQNRWQPTGGEKLGRSLYRLGMLDKLKTSLIYLKKYLNHDYILVFVYNILGDVYWTSGQIARAIDNHIKCNSIIDKIIKRKQNNTQKELEEIQFIKAASALNIGLCNLEIGELQQALQSIKTYQFLSIKFGFDHRQNLEIEANPLTLISWFCLAFICAKLNQKEEALYFANKVDRDRNIDALNWDPWAQGFLLLFLGNTFKYLGNFKKAFEFYQEAIQYAKKSNYIQVKGKALYGIAELYRLQKSFKNAFDCHDKSIDILDRVGAKCDLAEAYFQYGLTHQTLNHSEESEQNFDRAIALWKEIGAPKQIERVEQARRNQ